MTVEITNNHIEDLRSTFFKELEEKSISIHPQDFEKVKTNDDWLKRFLLHHEANEKEALSMLWDTVNWRKEFKTNEINDTNVNLDFLKEGILFSHGRDKDGCALFIFRCKNHVKGLRDFEDVKKCVIYWLERLERKEKGKQVTIFFDMEGCGVSNVDMELIKYIIHVFKQYYPFMLNYIIILEMAWILNALFKVVKTMLPEKAVQKIKFVKKGDLSQFVEPDQLLKCWGGNDNYVFVFVPEVEESTTTNPASLSNKKVHFADGSLSEQQSIPNDKESSDNGGGEALKVNPSAVITFSKEGSELVSTLELLNTQNYEITYKVKTTSPEKFRVRPSAGYLSPGDSATISVTLLPGFQLGGLSRDKFLLMSMPIDSVNHSVRDLIEVWKNPSSKLVFQHRLRCAQNEVTKNGAVTNTGSPLEIEPKVLYQLSTHLNELKECQSQLHVAIKRTKSMQLITMFLIVIMSVLVIGMLSDNNKNVVTTDYCKKSDVIDSIHP